MGSPSSSLTASPNGHSHLNCSFLTITWPKPVIFANASAASASVVIDATMSDKRRTVSPTNLISKSTTVTLLNFFAERAFLANVKSMFSLRKNSEPMTMKSNALTALPFIALRMNSNPSRPNTSSWLGSVEMPRPPPDERLLLRPCVANALKSNCFVMPDSNNTYAPSGTTNDHGGRWICTTTSTQT